MKEKPTRENARGARNEGGWWAVGRKMRKNSAGINSMEMGGYRRKRVLQPRPADVCTCPAKCA